MQKNKNKKSFRGKVLFAVMAAVILIITTVLVLIFNTSKNNVRIIPYTDFVRKMENGQIREVKEKDDFIITVIKEENNNVIYKREKITDRVGEDADLMGIIESKNINLRVQQPTGPNYFWPLVFNLFLFVGIPIAFIAGITTLVIVLCSLDRKQK